MRARVIWQLPLCVCLAYGCLAFAAPAETGKGGDPVQEFTKRVNDYVGLAKHLNSGLPALKPNSNPTEIATHKKLLATAIQHARRNARPGDIFSPPVQAYFIQLIRAETRGRAGSPARAAIREGNPKVAGSPKKVVMRVNANYPDDAPVSTVPPSLLLQLPQLPKEVEYRFVGRDLILRDATADIIIDFIRNAAPPS